MNYSSTYQKGADLFQAWYHNYIWRHGKLKSDHIKTFLYEMTWAYNLVPGLENIKEEEDGVLPKFTDDEKEVIYKYIHENPDNWYIFLIYL